MFADAIQKVMSFTKPLIISTRCYDGTVECGCGAFIVINQEGWIITVAHVFEAVQWYNISKKEILQYQEQVTHINQTSAPQKHKTKLIRHLKSNPKWITNNSYWYNGDGVRLVDAVFFPEGDLALGRIEPFDPISVSNFPVFKNPNNTLNTGTSLCKLGFPFHTIKATFDQSKGFILSEGALPLAFFPLEGIFTRNILVEKPPDCKYALKFLETSSPGLKGQSGGPIFDRDGTIWSIQSRTQSLDMGFSPKIVRNGKEVVENQILNVGWGAHPEMIFEFLTQNKINFKLSNS